MELDISGLDILAVLFFFGELLPEILNFDDGFGDATLIIFNFCFRSDAFH